MTLSHGGVQSFADRAKTVLRFEGAPVGPTQHSGTINQQDTMKLRAQDGIKKCLNSMSEASPGMNTDFSRNWVGACGKFQLYRVKNGAEQIAFVVKVMVQSAARDLGFLNYLLDWRGVVALTAEKLAGGSDDQITCRSRFFRPDSVSPHQILLTS
jgi:hypothetical protein